MSATTLSGTEAFLGLMLMTIPYKDPGTFPKDPGTFPKDPGTFPEANRELGPPGSHFQGRKSWF